MRRDADIIPALFLCFLLAVCTLPFLFKGAIYIVSGFMPPSKQQGGSEARLFRNRSVEETPLRRAEADEQKAFFTRLDFITAASTDALDHLFAFLR